MSPSLAVSISLVCLSLARLSLARPLSHLRSDSHSSRSLTLARSLTIPLSLSSRLPLPHSLTLSDLSVLRIDGLFSIAGCLFTCLSLLSLVVYLTRCPSHTRALLSPLSLVSFCLTHSQHWLLLTRPPLTRWLSLSHSSSLSPSPSLKGSLSHYSLTRSLSPSHVDGSLVVYLTPHSLSLSHMCSLVPPLTPSHPLACLKL